MERFTRILLVLISALFFSHQASALSSTPPTLSNQDQVNKCDFTKSGSWWENGTTPLPTSIAKNPATGDPEFCEFYQYAEDYFLYLISPSASGGSNWNDLSQFPLLETAGTNSCDETFPEHAFNVRNIKSVDDTTPYVLPERIDQASANAIYDQNGNIVFYEIRFSKNLCDYKSIQKNNDFPGGTVETKMAWKVLTGQPGDSQYIQTKATIDGTRYTLGLAGWHIVVSADNHPEMVWITLVHQGNAVICTDMSTKQTAYPFTSKECAQNPKNCTNLNQSTDSSSLTTSSPNDICQEFPYGTVEGQSIDTNDGLNIALIKKLNSTLQSSVFKQPGMPSALDKWTNYQFTGALWISDTSLDSSVTTNQRGSLELANEVMETTFQGTHGKAGSAVNCFGCHHYLAKQSNTSDTSRLSHIFDEIISGQTCVDVQTSQLVNSQAQAETTCPTTCSNEERTWNSQWTNQSAVTGQQLPMTVCGCCSSSSK